MPKKIRKTKKAEPKNVRVLLAEVMLLGDARTYGENPTRLNGLRVQTAALDYAAAVMGLDRR